MPYTVPPGNPAEPRWSFGVDDAVEARFLVPGVHIRRHTEPGPRDSLTVPVPCCGRRARLVDIGTHHHALIGCPFCHLLYDCILIDELDGGHAAVLEVRDEQITLARRHTHRASRGT
jgi:hypothetical protein